MSKFNTPAKAKSVGVGVITSEKTPSTRTYEGAAGYVRDAKGELFLLAVSNMVSEDTFYEKASDRDNRYAMLISQVAIEDFDWLFNMLVWLRSEGNMRSAPLVGAVEAVRARLAHEAAGAPNGPVSGPTSRALIAAVCQRADEPGEILAYWHGNYGRAVPKPIKRGVADAAARLYNERSLLKYDSERKGLSFGDVVDLTHPKSDLPWKNDLFRYAMDKHGRNEIPESLVMLNRRNALMKMEATYAEKLKWIKDNTNVPYLAEGGTFAQAGMTWESVAGWLQGPMTADVWQAIIPSMGYMALIRNLRNFDEAGVSDAMADLIGIKISNPEEVAKSRQFPFRFWSAYSNAPSARWVNPLEKAIKLATSNIPNLGGRTLILVDTSASMTSMGISKKSKMTPAQIAALFGISLAVKGENVDLVGFASDSFVHNVSKSASVLREVERFVARSGEVGHGTAMTLAVRKHYAGHDRVVCISDMQINGYDAGYSYGRGDISTAIPENIPLYGFNLQGYDRTMMALGKNRHEFGGMGDSSFRQIPLLEAGRDGKFPWELVK